MDPSPPSSQTVIESLLTRHGLTEPDGRPLYRYAAYKRELAGLRDALSDELHRRPPRPFAAMGFCLWAAEWWRRHYASGPWKWQPLLAELGHPEFAPGEVRYLHLHDLVARGLSRWKREVLQVGDSRRYLATLACEGGLPLSLLKRPTHLRSYLKAVMEECTLFQSAEVQARDLAEQARHFLPKSWRQHVVYELAAQLVQRILILQREVGESSTPVRDLDRTHPGWRDALPVRLSDDVARTLLNGLLLDAAEVARGGRIRVRWNVEMVPVGDDQWKLVGYFHIPVTIESVMFNRLFCRATDTPVPGRFDLSVQVDGGPVQPLAVVTRLRTAEQKGTYGVELLPATRRRHESGLQQARRLVARFLDESFFTDHFPGADGLTELPWVFAPKDAKDADEVAQQPCRLVGQGSVKIRERWGLVAASRDVSVEVHSDAAVNVLGTLCKRSRCVYRVRGKVTFVATDGARAVVETGALSSTSNVEYRLSGKQLSSRRGGPPVYLGNPKMHEWRDGEYESVPEENLEWKPDMRGARWRPYFGHEPVRGTGTLRYTRDAAVRHSVRLSVLPRHATVEIRPTTDELRGQILLQRFGDVQVAVAKPVGVNANGHAVSDEYCLELTTDDDPPYAVTVVVDWNGRERVALELPFPARRAVFLDARGQKLSRDATLTEGHLAGVRTEVVIPGTAEFSIQGQYRGTGTDANNIRCRGMLVRDVPRVRRGHYALDLALVQPAVADRLSCSDNLDGWVALRVHSNWSAGALAPTQIKVSRFDLELKHCPGAIDLDEASHAKMSEEELAAFMVEALPLLDTGLQPEVLQKRESGSGWRIPDTFDPGPYLIVGHQKDWQRARPLDIYAGDRRPHMDAKVENVRTAYAKWDAGADGMEAFREVARQLATQPSVTESDWPLVFAYLRETSLPVQVFPLLRALAGTSHACAMAAVIATPGELEVLWQRMEAFSFAWWQIPLYAWREAFTAYSKHVKAELAPLGDQEKIDRLFVSYVDSRIDRMKPLLPGLHVAFEFVRARLTGETIREAGRVARPDLLDSVQKMYTEKQRQCPAQYRSLRDLPPLPGLRACIRAIRDSSSWSHGLFVNRVGPFSEQKRADYADAPALTAASVVSGIELPANLARAIRDVREGEHEWFDDTLHYAHMIAFGRLQADKVSKALE